MNRLCLTARVFQIKRQVNTKLPNNNTQGNSIVNTKLGPWTQMIKERSKRESTAERGMKGNERQFKSTTGDNSGGDIDIEVIR